MTTADRSDPRETIIAAFDRLSAKQQRLAQFFLDNPYIIAFESANEIANRVAVSPATVVRFCQALGYDGYPQFQAIVRSRFPSGLTAIERGERELGVGEHVPERTIERVFAAELHCLERTREHLRPEELEAAAQALAAAPWVLVLGAGMAAGPASYFAHTLRVIGLDVHDYSSGGLPLAVALANAPAGSVMVTISIWRYVREVYEATLAARTLGLRCISVVDSIVSPVATHSDLAFVAVTGGVAHLLSLSGIMAALNTLAISVSQLRPQETLASLRRVDEQYRAGHLLLAD